MGFGWPVPEWSAEAKLVAGVLATTVGWLTVTFLTAPASKETLQSFHSAIRPMGRGWEGAGIDTGTPDPDESLTAAFAAWFLGCLTVYAALFGTGYVLYGNVGVGIACFGAAGLGAFGLLRIVPRVGLR